MKSRAGQRQREEKDQKREDQKRKSQKKEDADARKGRKVAIHCVFPMICGSGGSKSRLKLTTHGSAAVPTFLFPSPIVSLSAKAPIHCWLPPKTSGAGLRDIQQQTHRKLKGNPGNP